jgi:protocatechuate 3,4-dioxygenase beta subunit
VTRALTLAFVVATGALAYAQTRPVTGTAELAGRVVTADETQAPVRRAIVTVTGSELALGRSAITDDEGRFRFDGLPAGRFTLTASRPAFLTSAYGAKGPGRPGTAVTVAAGQRVADITIKLPRGAVIGGTVRDQNGEPVSGVPITILQANSATAPTKWTAANFAGRNLEVATDDQGAYRIYGLDPGMYLIGAAQRFAANQIERLSSEQMDAAFQDLQRTSGRPGGIGAADRQLTQTPAAPRVPPPYGYAPTYHPAAVNPALAAPITVAAGDERLGTDITLGIIRLSMIEGTVTDVNGPLPAVQMSIAMDSAMQLPFAFGSQPALTIQPTGEGRFRYVGVPPGTYTLTARSNSALRITTNGAGAIATMSQGPVPQTDRQLWAVTQVVVGSDDVTNVNLALEPGRRLSGRIAFDAATLTPPADLSTARVSMTSPSQGGSSSVNGTIYGRVPIPGAQVKPDGTFEFPSVVPGSYVFTSALSNATGWQLRSAIVNGKDVLDSPLEIPPTAGDISGAVVTFTDRHTALTGTLQTAAGTPATDYVVILFSTDRAAWRPQARRLLSTRPANDGAFALRDMPPGDYYLAALTDLDPNDWQNATFLDQVVPGALTITIGEGEQRVQDVRLAK